MKAGICDGDSSIPGSLHTGSMLSPHPCLRGSSTPGPSLNGVIVPQFPVTFPCSVLSEEILLSAVSWAA